MRQTLTGMMAAVGLMTVGAAPAMACGWGGCCGLYSPCAQTYATAYTYAPAYTYGYSGCGGCGNFGYAGWGFERLAAPTTQYYYVNQGPTYTGPGAFAPYPVYEENAVPVEHPARYGYYEGAGVAAPPVYGYRYGYARHHYRHYTYHYGPYYNGRRVLRRYY
ncbi:hypothetical protein [Bradyrhizobium sp. Tv2a-2]|uniref:hypothetical protein n=1 Tax=Bradyrhizobium sp. Tv2a-2 TaxID=113395 RepID=UPI000413B4EA|nr:hypothetical protein [Bradyrhizobium sp. Tv2a-2]